MWKLLSSVFNLQSEQSVRMKINGAWDLRDTSKQIACWVEHFASSYLFDIVFHWLWMCDDYENSSTQSHLSGLDMENFK